MANPAPNVMERIVSLCRRRGFIFQSSEIYGGINGFWDYGPLGVELKNNLRDAWWNDMVHRPPEGPTINGRRHEIDIVGLDCSIISHPKVWEASGHVASFADPTRKCRHCGGQVRADQVWDVLTQSLWVDSLLQVFEPVTGRIDAPHLLGWARGKGKRQAPNLALVRNPEVTLGWLTERINVQGDSPPDMKELLQYLATEQLAATGLQTPCPQCGGELDEARPFNLMFESHAGLSKSDDNRVYLRPETAQGMFYNFKNILDSTRIKVPFGIAQIGKSFRNEVTPRHFVYRSREFEQMEMEFFCPPEESQDWYIYWRDTRMAWWSSLGIRPEKLRLREHDKEELSHYSTGTADVEYQYPFTEPQFGELEGIAHRGCYDLTQHQTFSGAKLEYFDQERNQRYLPHVIEPAAGLTRGILVLLCEAYTLDESRPSPELMKFHPRLAPIKAAVFPLVNKDGLPEIAEPIYQAIHKRWTAQYDAKASIGKRYARMDEAGTPYCFTIDGQSKEDGTVTVRDRDTGQQERIDKSRCVEYLEEKLGA